MGVTHTLIRRAWNAIHEQQDYAYGRALLEEAAILAREAGDKVLISLGRVYAGIDFLAPG